MEVDTNGMEETNGHAHYNGHSEKRRETSEERRIRKDKERKAKENETEEERRIRKEKEKLNSSHRHKETDEERRIRKEKEKQNGEKRKETEEERRIRKEKEKAASGKREETEEERKARKNKERGETDEERRARKDRERAEKENGGGGEKKRETEEERRIRKEKEKSSGHREHGEKKKETEDERRIRKEKEKREKEKETPEERTARKERERKEKEKRHETEEERQARKERERREKKEKERRSEVKEEEMMELGDDYFAAEEARLDESKKAAKQESEEEEEAVDESAVKEETEDESVMKGEEEDEGEEVEDMEQDQEAGIKHEAEESDDDTKQGITMERMDSDDDVPLARRKKPAVKRKVESGDDSEDEPLSKKREKQKKVMKREPSYDAYEDEEDDYQRPSKKMKKPSAKKGSKKENKNNSSDKKMTKKEKELEEEKKVWKWWEEDLNLPEGVKWKFLEHKGPQFAPDYEPLPPDVRFWYDGKVLRLTEETEECATFYGRMLDHDYTTKEVFNKNFFKDWRKTMTEKEKEILRDLSKCDFSEIDAYFKKRTEERKSRTKDEKNKEKEENAAIVEEYGFCIMDGHKEKIGNFRTEPPSLFRGRGEHPKQGMIKRRIRPEDVIINCSKDSKIPEPPSGHKWKKVQHDNTVTWLASWTENIQGQIKYIMLNPSSRLKGEKDWQKYEKARALKKDIGKIREDYMADMKSKEMRVRQRAVAMYFIDKLALRAGNEKDADEQADTVGCCSLRVEHVELHELKDGREWVIEFDFLGKDSIRYHNEVSVDKKVYKNVKLFMENKKDGDDLFDRLNTTVLNQYLNSLMDGLTAKVFRTYNASFTLQNQLDELTEKDDNVAAKMLAYNRANRAVAVLCNHQRAVPKTHEKSMENLDVKLEAKQEAIKAAEKNLKHAKKAYKNNGSQNERATVDKCKKIVERLLEQLEKLEIQKTDKDENKTIALGTSKLNYLDPRISVQWCKSHDVPIEKVYNKTQREKFRWAIDMITNNDEPYHF